MTDGACGTEPAVTAEVACGPEFVSTAEVECQTTVAETGKLFQGVADVRVRIPVDKSQLLPGEQKKAGQSKLISLLELIKQCREKKQAVPTLTTMDEKYKAQNKASTYKARADSKDQEMVRLQEAHINATEEHAEAMVRLKEEHEDALNKLRQEHAAELTALREKHEVELQSVRPAARKLVDDVQQWNRIQQKQAERRAQQQAELAAKAHKAELAGRAKRSATWKAKRNQWARSKVRAEARAERANAKAKESAADAAAAAADNVELHAKIGRCVEIAPQRQHAGSRAAFTPATILRDLKTRQLSLNSGAKNVREVTKNISQSAAADGRNLELESGSERSILRWEKRADVVCMLQESKELRNAILDVPGTRIWASCDLSPDARAIEQFGMSIEYAGVNYVTEEGDAPPPFASERLSGVPLATCATAHFGPDGCPITVEWWRRVFTPMLAALGPKYASTCDCFMRTLQVYGSTVGQLLDPAMQFATVEQLDVAVPLVDHTEGLTSDAGGEVNKTGGVIDAVAPKASWRHCAAHGLNLALEKSKAFEKVGGSVRSASSFLRAGNKHHMLVHHMKCIQRPELAGAKDDARRRAIYRDAHEQVRRHGQFHPALGDASPGAVRKHLEQLEQLANEMEDEGELALVDDSTLEKKSKKGTDVRWKYECEVLDDRLLDIAHLLAPAILIEYGFGETYATLKIDGEKNKTAATTLATLVDPAFIFWATYMRLLYTRVYKGAFAAVQANHHHAAPLLAGPDGLPLQWAAAMRAAIAQPARSSGKVRLAESACAPLVSLLQRHAELGGVTGAVASEAVEDLEAQAQHLESYFRRWSTLEGLVHAVAREAVVQGPLTEQASELAVKLGVGYDDLLPRVPAAEALAAAAQGVQLFAAASEDERADLPGTLAWLLFSPKTREGAENPVFAEVKAFAAGDMNPHTRRAFPYRCWPGLTRTLVAGGAKYCPSTSAQLESLFTGLTRQQGAAKNNISQPHIAFEARCRKNTTMWTRSPRACCATIGPTPSTSSAYSTQRASGSATSGSPRTAS